jgi:probable F420-dependent oxidoreductase
MMNQRPFRFGVVTAGAPSSEAWLAKARRIEQLGYATLLMPDRLVVPMSPLPALAAAATVTQSLRLGTFVLASGLRNPVLLAKECATLDLLSGGRLEVGLGAGVAEIDFRMAGIPFHQPGPRVDRLAETVGIVKALLSGQEVNVSGTHYNAAGARLAPPPLQQPRPPILVAGAGKRVLSLAAREADVVGLGISPADDEAVVSEKVGWVREAAGSRFPDLELCLSLAAIEGDVPPEVAARIRERLQAYMHVDVDQLLRARVPSVLAGSMDEMCEQLLARRERLGISYVTVPDDLMEPFAPVVERLAGRS